jgi:hypothetical protein
MRTSGATYDEQAKGVFSPDGSKVMFNSDWGSGTVYAYVAEMPGNLGDTVFPTAPTNLRITGISQTEINLSWNASTDIVDVTDYLASRGGAQLTTVAERKTFDPGLERRDTVRLYPMRRLAPF